MPPVGDYRFSIRPHVKLCLHGASWKAPHQIHHFPALRLNSVMKTRTGQYFELLREVMLRWVCLKTQLPVGKTLVRRLSELATLLIKFNLCTDPIVQSKVSSILHRIREIYISNFCPNPTYPKQHQWHSLDMRRALKSDWLRMKQLRKLDLMFISVSSPNVGSSISRSAVIWSALI